MNLYFAAANRQSQGWEGWDKKNLRPRRLLSMITDELVTRQPGRYPQTHLADYVTRSISTMGTSLHWTTREPPNRNQSMNIERKLTIPAYHQTGGNNFLACR